MTAKRNFKRTGRRGRTQPGDKRHKTILVACWREMRTFYFPLFDATDRRNEQLTIVDLIFSSPEIIATIKRKKFNKSFGLKIWKKKTGKGVTPRFFIFLARIFFWIYGFLRLDLVEGHQKKLEPMHIARSVDFKQTGRVKEFWGAWLDGKALISYSILGAMNRRSKQQTTVLLDLTHC